MIICLIATEVLISRIDVIFALYVWSGIKNIYFLDKKLRYDRPLLPVRLGEDSK